MGFNHLVLEGDAKVIVEAINLEDVNWSMTGHLVMNMKTRLQDFEQWQVSTVGQERNSVAYCVPKMVVKEKLVKTWRVYYPNCICEIVSPSF